MRKKRTAPSRSKALSLSQTNLFGPPPLLEGEDAAAYDELLMRVSNALRPTDFVEEIWVRDIVDVTWNLSRLRRIQAAFLSAEVWDIANKKASSLADADPELMEGPETEEMIRLRSSDSGLSWEALCNQNPRAYKKFQKFWDAAMATLDMDEIQATVLLANLDTIGSIEHLIKVEEQRFDVVIREIDRRRFMQKHHNSNVLDFEEAEFKTIKAKRNVRKIPEKKVA